MKYKKPYQEQWNRVRRLRKSIDQFANATDENFEDAVDSFTSFFIQCYHLRDWLIKSGFSQVSVDNHIKKHTWLSLCRDLANTQKHQEIDRYKPDNDFVKDQFFGVSTPITRHYDYFIYKGPRFGINVWGLGMPVDVVEVADKCIEEWDTFLKLQDRFAISV